MALTGREQAVLALHRFGLGPQPSSVVAIASDPRGALLAELDRPGAGLIAGADLQTSAQAFRAVADANAERQAKQVLAMRKQKEIERQQAEGGSMGDGMQEAASGTPPAAMAPEPPQPTVGRDIFLKEVRARIDAALAAEIGFTERLVWFWSNHFCISANKIQSMAGGYEREAIRPNVLGRFGDHAARRREPSGDAVLSRQRGLDRTQLDRRHQPQPRPQREPGARNPRAAHAGRGAAATPRTTSSLSPRCSPAGPSCPSSTIPSTAASSSSIGGCTSRDRRPCSARSMPTTSAEQGRAVLRDLARHPATAKHVATKLARHFVADEPPPALVERLARTFTDTDGDLKEVSRPWSRRRRRGPRHASSSSARANG